MPCEYIRLGGAGSKSLKLIEGDIDVYNYPRDGGLSSWDICAGEALIKGIGGRVTN
jgi:3'-phosphoadenosine 5'-phosphosulfate (PAPS) 3'-phosphatase